MQITGVFRNCICYSDARFWYNINNINPTVNLASDTQDARNSSHYWIKMGSTATVFMAVNCYIGWWYQRLIRHRFTDAVKAMYTLPEGDRFPNVDVTPGSDGENEDAALSDRGLGSAEERETLLHDPARTWASGTIETLTRRLYPDLSNSSNGSRTSHESMGDEIEQLPSPIRDGAMAGS